MARFLALLQSPRFGGDDAVLLELLRAWPAGDEWTVALNATHPGRPVYESESAGRATLTLLPVPSDAEPDAPGAASAALRLAPAIAAARPDAVLISSGGFPPTSLTLGFLMAARLARAPRVVLAVHNEPNLGGGLRAVWRGWRGRLARALSDELVSVSADCSAKVAAACGGSVRTIPNGATPRPAGEAPGALRAELGVPAGVPLIGAIGNLEARKGFRTLLEAFRLVAAKRADARLVVVGAPAEPAEEFALRALAADPALSGRVALAGYRPRAWRYAAAFDIVAVPSLRSESFGLAALDGMLAGKPVVAARVGGLPEVVADGETGLLVPPGDPEALAAALERLLADPGLAQRLGEAGRARAAERFSAARMAAAYREALLGSPK